MTTKRMFYAICVIFLIANIGCGSGMTGMTRSVSEDNVFSSPLPEFNLRINPELKYLGEFDEGVRAHNSTYNHNIYFFGQIDDRNIYQKGVMVEYLSLPSDLRWRGDPHLNTEGAIKTGTMNWGEREAEYVIAKGNPFSPEVKTFLTEKGYELPQCYTLKVSTQQQTWARVYMLYFDRSFPCNKKLSPENVDTFMLNSEADMIFE